MTDQKDKLAILFVHAVDASETPEQAGTTADNPKMEEPMAVVRNIALEFRGEVIRSANDSFMCSFPDAESAVSAACDMQARTQKYLSAPAHKVSFCIGMHVGSALTAGVVAQRMAGFAQAGQIITNEDTLPLLPEAQRETTCKHSISRKSKREAIIVHEIVWKTNFSETETLMRPFAAVRVASETRLHLLYANREIPVLISVNIGRRPVHDIVLADRKASRDHACILRRGDQFVLIDQSTHGTFVKLENGEEHALHHQELVLHRNGVMSFGRRVSENGVEIVNFRFDVGGVASQQAGIKN
jgi:adenylate cyclase